MTSRADFVYAPLAQRVLWRVVILAVAAGLLVFMADRQGLLGGSAQASTTDPGAACLPGQAVPIMGYPHISEAVADDVVYNSNPPSSGPHFAASIAPGIYRSYLEPGLTVHSLEHGRVVIQYLPGTSGGVVADLERIAKRYAPNVVLSPNPNLDSTIALAAWGRIDTLESYDETRIATFVERLSRRYNHKFNQKAYGCP